MKKRIATTLGAFTIAVLVTACDNEVSLPYEGAWAMDAGKSIDASSNTFDMPREQFVFVMEMWADAILNDVTIQSDGFVVDGDLEGDSFSISCNFDNTSSSQASGPCNLALGDDSTTESVTWSYVNNDSDERLVGEGLEKMVIVLTRTN